MRGAGKNTRAFGALLVLILVLAGLAILFFLYSITRCSVTVCVYNHGSILCRRRYVFNPICRTVCRASSLTPPAELLNIHNAFHQGQYETVIDFDTSSLSAENKIPARVLQLRAQIANGQAKEVLSIIKKEGDAPDFAAVKALAQYTSGNTSGAVSEVEKLTETHSANATVQLLGGTVLQAAGKTEEALSLLSKHQGSLEAYVGSPADCHVHAGRLTRWDE